MGPRRSDRATRISALGWTGRSCEGRARQHDRGRSATSLQETALRFLGGDEITASVPTSRFASARVFFGRGRLVLFLRRQQDTDHRIVSYGREVALDGGE